MIEAPNTPCHVEDWSESWVIIQTESWLLITAETLRIYFLYQCCCCAGGCIHGQFEEEQAPGGEEKNNFASHKCTTLYLHLCLPNLDLKISSAEMLVVFGQARRTLSQESHASQTFYPQFCRGDRHSNTKSHSANRERTRSRSKPHTRGPWSPWSPCKSQKEFVLKYKALSDTEHTRQCMHSCALTNTQTRAHVKHTI